MTSSMQALARFQPVTSHESYEMSSGFIEDVERILGERRKSVDLAVSATMPSRFCASRRGHPHAQRIAIEHKRSTPAILSAFSTWPNAELDVLDAVLELEEPTRC